MSADIPRLRDSFEDATRSSRSKTARMVKAGRKELRVRKKGGKRGKREREESEEEERKKAAKDSSSITGAVFF